MTATARIFSTVSIFAIALARTPCFAADYAVRVGEVRGSAHKTVVETTTIKMCDKSTGYRFGYEIVPAGKRSYETYSLLYVPGSPQPLRTMTLRRQGSFVPWFYFDRGDPLGTYKFVVFVDGNKTATVEFQVVSVTSCPLDIDELLAGSCSEAVERVNAQNRADSAWYVEQYRAAFGANPKDFRVDYHSVDHCRKMLPISKARLERATEFGKLDDAFVRKCPHAIIKQTAAPEGLAGRSSQSKLVGGIRAGIELCEKTLAGRLSGGIRHRQGGL